MELLARDSIRILHVEDDNDFAELSARNLRKGGFTQPVIRCTNGLLAVRYFSTLDPKCAPHVILLDLHMPGMNGLEVLHWVRENYGDADAVVYLLTSSEDPEHQRQAKADRVTEYLLKNPSADILIEKLDRLIALSNTPPDKRD